MGKATLQTVVFGLALVTFASMGMASSLTRAADKLVADQINSGSAADGSWPSEPNFAGEPTIGLCRAYEFTNNIAYKTAAENGGAYSLDYAGYNAGTSSFSFALFPAEAYAMARLSAIQATPASNQWRTALVDNLNAVNTGTAIAAYQAREVSSAVYDVARMTVAANYANHSSKTIWRDGLITLLGGDLENSAAPVMALGSAVWALASTGDMSTDTGEAWTGVQVMDLPGILAEWQAPDDSFYTRFDNTQGEGFTETTVMGALGLISADASSASYSYSVEAAAAAGVLGSGVDNPGGEVYWGINNPLSGSKYFLAGETLEVVTSLGYNYRMLIAELGLTGPIGELEADYNQDGRVNLADFVILRGRFASASTASAPLGNEVVGAPEPTTMILMAAGGLAVIRRRRLRSM